MDVLAESRSKRARVYVLGRSSMHVVPHRYSIEKCSNAGHKRRRSGNLTETECDESDSYVLDLFDYREARAGSTALASAYD